jgi:voltage-dependent anion channel protein 2
MFGFRKDRFSKTEQFTLGGNPPPPPPGAPHHPPVANAPPMDKPVGKPIVPPPPIFHPLAFREVGKAINVLLGADYPTNGIRLDARSVTSTGVNFSVNGFRDAKTGAISGEMRTRYHDKVHGVVFSEGWNSNNVLSSTIEFFNTLSPGLRLEVSSSYNPTNGTKNARIAADYKKRNMFSRCNIDLFKGPTVNGDFCIHQNGVLIGGDASYNLRDSKLTRYNVGVAYNTPEYSLALQAFEGFNTYAASYFHKIKPELEAGTKATWNKSSAGPVNIEFGTRYILNKDAFVKAKIDMNGRLGLGYTQHLDNGVRVSVGGSFDTQRLGENVHKVGMNLSFFQ